MKSFHAIKWLSALPLLFAACSDSGSSSNSGNGPNPIDKIEVGACESIDDPTLNAQVTEATDSLIQFIFGILDAPKDVEALQNDAKRSKDIFAAALKSHPNSCDAQLGLAAAQIASVINDKDVAIIYNTFANGDDAQKFSLINIRQTFAEATLQAGTRANAKLDDKLITDRVQGIIANAALPSIDSAIYLLNNIRKSENYRFSRQTDDLEIYLGTGELALSVGTLNAIKAFLTVVASLNLDASKDNSHNWLITSKNWLDKDIEPFGDFKMTSEEKAALKHATSLFDEKSPFLSVKESWKSAYKSVPDILDSAIDDLKESYEILLGQAESGDLTSLSPLVGAGEESDMHPGEIEKTLAILDSVQKALHGTITVTLYGEPVQIDVRKFFNITDGFQKYLPYHSFTPVDSWTEPFTNPDSKYVSWISLEDYTGYYYTPFAKTSIENAVSENWNTSATYIDFELYTSGLLIYIEDENGHSAYGQILRGSCKCSLQSLFNRYPEFEFTLDSSVCKTENGETLLKAIDANLLPNPFNFTDKNGKVTYSFTDFDKEIRSLFNRDATKEDFSVLFEKAVIFPDPTFGGVFPDMTQRKISVFLADLYY